ncbi:MAG TPA: endonuclease/exonuclease/phosphatase family protein [Nitrososphaeraceae archaeon]|nr:endonuclease/exonuclease/phosphatase family protein [Nitrososphaeraceae archaeon]
MSNYNLAWWNVENLFDTEDSPNRTDKLKRALGKEIEGWTATILNKKIDQLSKIILTFNNNTGPDLLGVCEVENRPVVERLADSLSDLHQRSYKVIHADTSDERGIDVAFIYDSKKLEIERDQDNNKLVFSHFILKRVATRDILQVNFKTKPNGNRLVVIGNHWPSRSGGQYESEPYRMLAGETLSYFHKRILEENKDEDGKTAIIVMGDLNDEPHNRSITEYALASRSIPRVQESKKAPRLYNLMWSSMAQGLGTFFYNSFPNLLDQFLISRGIVEEHKISVTSDSVQVIAYPEMMGGKFNAPVPFGRPSNKSLNLKGFSDHFPISVTIEET